MAFGDAAVIHGGDFIFVFTRQDIPELPESLRQHAEDVFEDYRMKHPDYEPLD